VLKTAVAPSRAALMPKCLQWRWVMEGGNTARPQYGSVFVFLARDFGIKVMICLFYLSFLSIFEEEDNNPDFKAPGGHQMCGKDRQTSAGRPLW